MPASKRIATAIDHVLFVGLDDIASGMLTISKYINDLSMQRNVANKMDLISPAQMNNKKRQSELLSLWVWLDRINSQKSQAYASVIGMSEDRVKRELRVLNQMTSGINVLVISLSATRMALIFDTNLRKAFERIKSSTAFVQGMSGHIEMTDAVEGIFADDYQYRLETAFVIAKRFNKKFKPEE